MPLEIAAGKTFFRARIEALRTAVACALALAACAPLPPKKIPAGRTTPAETIRVVDGDHVLSRQEVARVIDKLHREDGNGALVRHLEHTEASIDSPLAIGNDARLLIDGPAANRAMLTAIAGAQDHINLETYILESGPVGTRLAALLELKRAEGIRVRVLYDGFGSGRTPPEYFERLRKAGVQVCEFNPLNPLKAGSQWRINNRDHRKILVVDGRIAITGGINISNVYASNPSRSGVKVARDKGWRDTDVVVQGPIVAQFQRLFLSDWYGQKCPAGVPGDYFPKLRRKGDKAMRLLAADPEAGESEMYKSLVSVIGHARRRVWLTCGYFVPDAQLVRTLSSAARTGVDVRLILPSFSDLWAPLYAGRSHYEDLLEAGVRVYERRDALLHAKTAVIDGVWSSVGSTNLDWRSFVYNYEADVVILEAEFGAEMEELFRADLAASTEVTPAAWRERGALERLKELVARGVQGLL